MILTQSIKKIKSKLPALLALCFLLPGKNLVAQNATSSPYSRFGIGDLNSITFARNLAMGGTEIGLDQPGFINFGNPAAYSSLWYTTYEGAADFKQYSLKSGNVVHHTNTASLSYFDFAFPIKPKKWSLGFGLMPYSKVGYSITETKTTDFGDKEIRTYDGSGGLNNFHLGTGFKITKRISAGISAEYLFGGINNDRVVGFSSPYYINTAMSSNTSIGWFHFKTGFQYHIDSLLLGKSDSIIMLENKLFLLEDSLTRFINSSGSDTTQEIYAEKNKLAQSIAETKLIKNNVKQKKRKSEWSMVLGLVLEPEAGLNANNATLDRTFRYYNYSVVSNTLPRDTIINAEGEEGDVTLPFKAGIGISFYKGTQWLFCSDFSTQRWSQFSFLGAEDSLVDSWKVSAGIQYTPNDRSVKSYFKTVQYRLGFHYEKGFLNLNGKDINEAGVSVGFGLPIRKASTILHFTIEGGQRGTTENDLVRERFLKFTFGFTINDRWFVRSKYD